MKTWCHYHCHSSTELLGNSSNDPCSEWKYAELRLSLTSTTTSVLSTPARQKKMNFRWLKPSEPWDEAHMQGNTDRAGVCRSSEVAAQVIKDAAFYAIFPGRVSFLAQCGSLVSFMIQSSEGSGCVWVCVGCSCILVWILSSSGLSNQRDLQYPSINTFFEPWKIDGSREIGCSREGPSLSASEADWTGICGLSTPAGAVREEKEQRCHFDNTEIRRSSLSPQLWSLPQSSCLSSKI